MLAVEINLSTQASTKCSPIQTLFTHQGKSCIFCSTKLYSSQARGKRLNKWIILKSCKCKYSLSHRTGTKYARKFTEQAKNTFKRLAKQVAVGFSNKAYFSDKIGLFSKSGIIFNEIKSEKALQTILAFTPKFNLPQVKRKLISSFKMFMYVLSYLFLNDVRLKLQGIYKILGKFQILVGTEPSPCPSVNHKTLAIAATIYSVGDIGLSILPNFF